MMKNKYFVKIKLYLLFILFWFFNLNPNVSMIVFSFDRPLQLYALLESVEKYFSNVADISVIYRTSNDIYSSAYEDVKNRFKYHSFLQQKVAPYNNFKELTIKCVNEIQSDYLMFAVDDIVVTDFVDLGLCEKILKITKAYGFYLRLGYNITECYMQNIKTPVPINKLIEHNIYIYKFKDSKGDWRYPNSLDMAIYNKADIIREIYKLNFNSPNKLEGEWSLKANLNKLGLFFKESKIVNIPLNLVNIDYRRNKNLNYFSAQDLLQKFQNGFKIDIDGLYKIQNKSTHIDFIPRFVKKN